MKLITFAVVHVCCVLLHAAVRCASTLSAAARVHLVRRDPRLAALQLRRQGDHHRFAARAAASDGCNLPADATKSRRTIGSHAVHEVHVPQHIIRRLPVSADSRVDKCRQFGCRSPHAPAAARTSTDHPRMAHRPLRHGSVCSRLYMLLAFCM